jgi:hypothetical protein
MITITCHLSHYLVSCRGGKGFLLFGAQNCWLRGGLVDVAARCRWLGAPDSHRRLHSAAAAQADQRCLHINGLEDTEYWFVFELVFDSFQVWSVVDLKTASKS